LAIDEEGINLSTQLNLNHSKSQFHDNLANCYMYMGQYTKSYDHFMKCLQYDSVLGNYKQVSDTYLNLGTLFKLQHKYAEAISYLNQSIELAKGIQYKEAVYQSYKLMSEIYQQNSQNDLSIDYLNKAYAVKDSIININSENKIAELETVYQTKRKENQLSLQDAQITKKNYLLAGLAALIVLITLLGTTFYRKQQIKNKMQLQSELMVQQNMATSAVLAAEENERQRIAADLHDGVGQMMSAAKMNLSAFESSIHFDNDHQKQHFDKVIRMIDDGCREIRSISHQMMPNALLKSNLSGAVKDFIEKINHPVLKIHFHTEGELNQLDKNTESVLYRIIQECVNNVIKHAEATLLDIAIIQDTDGISVSIEDNGKGFNIKNKSAVDGIGLNNIRSRVNFLKGTVDFDSATGKGTLVAIHIPVN